MRAAPLAIALGHSLLAVTSATAAERIVVGDLKGDRNSLVEHQLSAELCDAFECVPRYRVTTGTKLDLQRVASEGVSAVLTGSVERRSSGSRLWLLVLRPAGEPSPSWTFALGADARLAPEDLEIVRHELARNERPAPVHVASRRPAAPASAAGTGGNVGAAPPRAAAATWLPPPPPPPSVDPPPVRPDPRTAPARARQRSLVAVEAGPFFMSRKLSYAGTSPGSLAPLGYEVPLVSGPWMALEAFPFSRATDGLAAGIGVIVSAGTSTGFTSRAPDGQATATQAWSLRAGAQWRLDVTGSGLALVPSLSYLRRSFALDPAFPGLPNSDLSGLEAALRLEVPVVRRLTLLAGGAYVDWLHAGDLVGTYFPGGSAWGLEAEAGIDIRIWGTLSLKGLATYDLTTYSLTPSGDYQATSASDQSLGGRVVLRVSY